MIDCSGVKVGGGAFAVIAGPCSVETDEQLLSVARSVKAAGATMLRGGAFKPRTSPYSFQGLGAEGLRILAAAKKETGLPIVTELMDFKDIDLFNDVDVIQIGARNMQNFNLLKEVGAHTKKPILLKRGMSATLQELLMSAEYIMASGNPIDKFYQTDPSHATGYSYMVESVSTAAAAIGADGLIIEVHNDPPHAKCDGAQSQTPEMFARTMAKIAKVRAALA